MREFTVDNQEIVSLRPLSAPHIEQVRQLCDQCVGQNLYTAQSLRAACEDREHFFYILQRENGEIVGYLYFYLTDIEKIAQSAKLDKNLFRRVCTGQAKKVGKIQAVGLKPEYRKRNLAEKLVAFAVAELAEHSVDGVFIVCWKPGGVVPLGKALGRCGFRFLAEAKKVWYDDADLICPCCKGRCVCDGAVYYKIPGGTAYETETSA